MKKQLSIIPRPVSVKYGEGVFQSAMPSIKEDGNFAKEIETVTGQLRGDLRCKMRGDLKKMGYSGQFDEKKSVFCSKEIFNDLKDADETYKLTITTEKISITAASGKGLYNGLQTFRQLVLSEFRDGMLTLPCAEIIDYPRFSWRGFMLDCARYFYSAAFVKNLIDILSLHHINRFHWHLTDDQGWRLPVAEYPLLTEIGSKRQDYRRVWMSHISGFYTAKEIDEVVEYAAVRHVEVVPEIDLPGHASAILASYPGLGCTGGPYRVEDRFGIFEDVLCAGNDQIFDLAEKIFDALAGFFPFGYVHIGGDEVRYNRWNDCPKCQKRLRELGLKKPEELQSWITFKLTEMLAKRKKTAIGWDEVLDDSEKFKLPKETVVMSWRGSEGGIRASGLGHPVIMSPNTAGCYLDYKHLDEPEEPGQLFEGAASVYKSYSLEPVTPEMSKEAASRILGGQCNMWSELIYAGKIAEYMIFPRLCAIAEAVWTEDKDFEDFSARLAVHRERLDNLGINQYRGHLR
ncbi:MAG: beta-N-acetylhexosaminidase [Treponema sp.]|jgi:hexosaminidase|nr:beta-N-acetylhexosaminidase [Treponema sp.]